MAKKMTQKEFKAALEKAGMHWENWGFEGILNMIAVGCIHEEKDYLAHGMEAGAGMMRRRINAINEVLNDRGYFKG